MMVPHPEPARISLQVSHQPVGSLPEFSLVLRIFRSAEEVVISQSPLRNCDGVVLQSDLAVIIQHGNSHGIAGPLVASLLYKRHVVLAQFSDWGIPVHFRRLMPEGKLAPARDQVGPKDTTVILIAAGQRHDGKFFEL